MTKENEKRALKEGAVGGNLAIGVVDKLQERK